MHQIHITCAAPIGIITIPANKVEKGLAVHKVYHTDGLAEKNTQNHRGNSYTITHIASGLRCYGKFLTYKEALQLLEYLLKTNVDWLQNAQYVTLNKDIVKAAIQQFEDDCIYSATYRTMLARKGNNA